MSYTRFIRGNYLRFNDLDENIIPMGIVLMVCSGGVTLFFPVQTLKILPNTKVTNSKHFKILLIIEDIIILNKEDEKQFNIYTEKFQMKKILYPN